MTSEEKYMGIDIAVPSGTEVLAAKAGKVVFTGDTIPGYGKLVLIEHNSKYATCYAQLGRILVSEGQRLKRGQVLGRSGRRSGGVEPYLHFEIRRDGEAVNPVTYLP